MSASSSLKGEEKAPTGCRAPAVFKNQLAVAPGSALLGLSLSTESIYKTSLDFPNFYTFQISASSQYGLLSRSSLSRTKAVRSLQVCMHNRRLWPQDRYHGPHVSLPLLRPSPMTNSHFKTQDTRLHAVLIRSLFEDVTPRVRERSVAFKCASKTSKEHGWELRLPSLVSMYHLPMLPSCAATVS